MLGLRPIATNAIGATGDGMPTIVVLAALQSGAADLNAMVYNRINTGAVALQSGRATVVAAARDFINANGVLVSGYAEVTGDARFNIARFVGDLECSLVDVNAVASPKVNASGVLVSQATHLVAGSNIYQHLTGALHSQDAHLVSSAQWRINTSGVLQSGLVHVVSSVKPKINVNGVLQSEYVTFDINLLVVLRRLAVWGFITRLDREKVDD